MPTSPLLRNAIESLEHGLDHYSRNTGLDRKFAILHIDQAVELILKEAVRSMGLSIYRRDRKTTIGLHEALDVLQDRGIAVQERPNLELLHDERNNIQHTNSTPDEDTTVFYVETVLRFTSQFLPNQLGANLEELMSPKDYEVIYGTFEDRDVESKMQSLLESSAKNSILDTISSIISASICLELILRYRLLETNENVGQMTIEELLELAGESGVLDAESQAFARNLLAVRNRVMHEEYIPSTEQSVDFYHFVKRLVEEGSG